MNRFMCVPAEFGSRLLYALMVVLLLADRPSAAQAPGIKLPPDTVKVHRLSVDIYDVFDSTESFYKFRAARAANVLHITTKSAVIHRELLFLPDSLVTIERMRESAYNLHQLGIFQSVSISVDTVSYGAGDIRVVVKDHFSTEINPAFSIEGGKRRSAIGIQEKNLVGLGYKCSFDVSNKEDRNFFQINYANPRFFGSRFAHNIMYKRYEDAKITGIGLNRLFYSQETQWDAGGEYLKSTGKQIAYHSSAEYEKINHFIEQYNMFYGYYWGSTVRKRAGIRLYYLDEQWTDITAPYTPHDRRFRGVSFSIGAIQRSIALSNDIDRSDVDEYVHTGFMVNSSIGFESPVWGADRQRIVYNVSGIYARSLTKNNYLFTELNDGRIFTAHASREHISNVRMTFFSTSFAHHTIAARAEYNDIAIPQPYNQLCLGENTGLRGYTNRQFIGKKRVVFGIEDRIFTPLQLWFVRFGTALFVDTGTVWNNASDVTAAKWHTAAGFGLWFGIPKISRGIVRVDCAYNIERKRFMMISLSNGSFFTVLYPITIGVQNFPLSLFN